MAIRHGFSMIISRGVIVAEENETALYAAGLMKENNIGAIVILKRDKVIGIVSERDIVQRVVANGMSPEKTKIKEFMTKNVVTANLEDGLEQAYQLLCRSKFRHLPILQHGQLIGIASQRDVLYGLKMKK